MSLTPGTRLGPYEVSVQIGVGGMGEVYRATDVTLKRQVAIKVLPAALASDVERLARFQREAEVLALLNHPNIAAIYGFERSAGVSALVMEYVDGQTLADRIAQGRIPLDESLRIAQQIAQALEAAHERGIVHRDLKPANIKVRSDGTVKLLDFGLAKAVDAASVSGISPSTGPAAGSPTITSPAFTQLGTIMGTAAYMAPEQARGAPADQRSDIWAFGVVLSEMVSGRRLFEGEGVSDTIAAVLTREPVLDGVPPALRRLIRSCLVKDSRHRLRHIGDALALVDDSAAALPAGPSQRGWRRLASIAAVLLVGLVAAVIWLSLRPRAVNDEVTRFYVDAPPGAAFNYTYTAASLSPDGRQMVFRIATANQAPALWLRPLGAFEGRRISGSDGADFPFWSPDGSSVAFFSDGKLKRVDLTGSSPILICDASDADTITTGGSWNADGVMIFGSPQGMSRVSAAGGVPTLVAPVDASLKETGYGDPQFLPDGDRFLMFVRSEDPKRQGYYISSLAHPDQKALLFTTKTKAVFVANQGGDSSYLLSLQDRTLLARRVDRRSLAPIGDPVPLASDVAVFPIGFQASFWHPHRVICSPIERTRLTARVSRGFIPMANGRPKPAPTTSTPTSGCRPTGPGRRCNWPTARATWISGRGTSRGGSRPVRRSTPNRIGRPPGRRPAVRSRSRRCERGCGRSSEETCPAGTSMSS